MTVGCTSAEIQWKQDSIDLEDDEVQAISESEKGACHSWESVQALFSDQEIMGPQNGLVIKHYAQSIVEYSQRSMPDTDVKQNSTEVRHSTDSLQRSKTPVIKILTISTKFWIG